MRRVGAVVGLGQAERERDLAAQRALHEQLLLLGRAELVGEDHRREVADHRDLALRVVVQADPEPVEVLAHDRHRQVRAAAAAELLGQRVAPQPGAVGAVDHLLEQVLPLAPRDPAGLEVGARVLATVVEEAGVVALGFQRPHLARR